MLKEESKFPSLLNEGGSSIPSNRLEQIVAMTEKLTTADGRHQTLIPFLSISRYSHQTPPIPVVLAPSFCLILQGTKKVHLGSHIVHAGAGDFLISMIDLPASAQVNGAAQEYPYIGLRIDFTTQEIASVITEAQVKVSPRDKKANIGAFIGASDTDLLDVFIRLLKLIDKPEEEVRYLSGFIKREMIFRLLSGNYGHLFFQQVFFDQQADGVGKAISWIKENFARSFTVEELAKAINMSVSGLHHKFKTITTMGPLQYQKQLRLQEARRLMLSGSMDATTAAVEVGYESSSQFSREYRRLFGLPPLQDIKALKKHSAADLLEKSGILSFR
ncbi:AraC family transcriptional regulator N-terminal domain-containing protein [Paenibacillus sepulcri]|uniref:AraC family transcriptional regulator n=1 Tax=Paenibacillus sepulcri TaxID=359917 RepID=A0ABS7CBS2_9BACL|nr:AraC family transcriptional regulator [Paenibacillus sepulcri]